MFLLYFKDSQIAYLITITFFVFVLMAVLIILNFINVENRLKK